MRGDVLEMVSQATGDAERKGAQRLCGEGEGGATPRAALFSEGSSIRSPGTLSTAPFPLEIQVALLFFVTEIMFFPSYPGDI